MYKMGQVLDLERHRRVTKQQYDGYVQNLANLRDNRLLAHARLRTLANRFALVYFASLTLLFVVWMSMVALNRLSLMLAPKLLFVLTLVFSVIWLATEWRRWAIEWHISTLNYMVDRWVAFGRCFEADYISRSRLSRDDYWAVRK